MDLSNLQDPELAFLAALAGGLLTLVGAVSVQRNAVRQQVIDRRAAVYEELLAILAKYLTTKELRMEKNRIRTLVDAISEDPKKWLTDQLTAQGYKRQSINHVDVSDVLKEILKEIEKKLSLISELLEKYRPQQEEFQQVLLMDAKSAMYTTPMVMSQFQRVGAVAQEAQEEHQTKALDVAEYRNQLERLQRLMRREILWSRRSLPWRVTLLVHSWWVRWTNWRVLRRR